MKALSLGTATAASTIRTTNNIIAVVGLNPALQKRFVLDPGVSLRPGDVHRACRPVTTGIGGKGQDVAVALSCLMKETEVGDDNDNDEAHRHIHVSLLQFVGRGAAGDEFLDLLAQRCPGLDSASSTTVRTAAALRTCTSIVAHDATTELVEPNGGIVTTDEFTALLDKIPQLRQNNDGSIISAVCFMGSLPPGCPDDAYAQIYQRIVEDNIMASRSSSAAPADNNADPPPPLCVVDSVVGLEALLAATIPQRTVLKLNVAEFNRLVGGPFPPEEDNCDDETTAAGSRPERVVVRAVQEFRRHYKDGGCHVAVTDGPRPAYLDDGVMLLLIPVPTLFPTNNERLLFPIGAGDAVAAGLIWAWSNNNSNNNDSCCLADAFSFGLACGTASCFHEENSVLDPRVVANLYVQQTPSTVLYRHDDGSSS
jgi:fructose-1-phosphate kinase PfkB-like protein